MRTRSDVFSLIKAENTDWPVALVSYQKGVAAMRELDPPATDPPTDKDSWQYLAAVHGRGIDGGPDGEEEDHSDPLWTTCQHGSWFFFPWHRMYLLTLESFIQHFSGDTEWSLPYWYSVNPDDPSTAVLPTAFRQPADNTNALYVDQRSTRAKTGQPIADSTIMSRLSTQFIKNLKVPNFSAANGAPSFGGGEYATPQFQHDEMGAAESIPHGPVHNLVGSDYDPATTNPIPPYGFMTDLLTAARDPIFWLHHSNIDRLWQMWLDLDPAHANLTDTSWLKTSFTFPAPGGGTTSWDVSDVLDTTALGYQYDTVAPPHALVAVQAPRPRLRPPEVELDLSAPIPPPSPQLVGAAVNVPISAGVGADITLSEPAVQPRALIADAAGPRPQQWLLRLEGVTGSGAAPLYDVYLNLPIGAAPEDHTDRLAGTISTFGVQAASRPGGTHDGGGLSFVLDISDVHDALAAAGEWDPATVRVAFAPLVPPAADEAGFAERMAAAPAPLQNLRAGRIAVLVA